MPRIPNAFKFRAADRTVLDTTLFLHLYCPILLDLLDQSDLAVPKLLLLRGSPGSGKSSLLRLFESETLLALHARRGHQSDQPLIDDLTRLGAIDEQGPRAIGIYIDCDSSLRDIANLDVEGVNAKLLNTMLDMLIVSSFIRSLRLLINAGVIGQEAATAGLPPLPAEETPPPIFAREQTLSALEDDCLRAEADFSTLLNSFPGEPVPASIQPHARIFSVPYLNHLVNKVDPIKRVLPLIMLDNLHELYEAQRSQVIDDFLRRSGIPRWVAIRKHVYELEELISLEGATDNRDYRELDLDAAPTGAFRRFVANVAERRLRQSTALQQYNVYDFKTQLKDAEPSIRRSQADEEIAAIISRLRELQEHTDDPSPVFLEEGVAVESLNALEGRLLMAERKAGRKQQTMFPEAEPLEPLDAKTQEAARLFAARRFKLPYYYSFETLSDVANGNVEQFLSVASILADRMIFRAEIGRESALSAREQQDLILQGAEAYYNNIEQRFDRGYSIRQLIDNLAPFFHAVTYRPNAPIAPGVNGFGLPREKLRTVLAQREGDSDVMTLRKVLTSAVAGNVLFVRLTKQGQVGAEKIVFYFNRLLCVKYNLPLNTGGWQPLPVDTLVRMMKGPVRARDWGKRWASAQQLNFEETTA
jgi:hypothetical protein